MSADGKIGAKELSRQLARICTRTGQGFPSRSRHQHIVLGGVTLGIPADRPLDERELNERLQTWLRDVGPAVEIDHVSLRRRLVDHGYLVRDAAGVAYRVDPGWIAARFEPEVAGLDPATIVAEATAARERRKQEHLRRRAEQPPDEPG
ncbi:MAG: DUF2087 domain-containing protein [Nannocystaceae bacterium]